MSIIVDMIDDLLADDDVAVSITYNRGADSVDDLIALIQSADYELVDHIGHVIYVQGHDYILRAEDLVIDNVAILPQRGDVIEQTMGDYIYRFEVLDIAGRGCYGYEDTERKLFRIHAKQISVEEAGS